MSAKVLCVDDDSNVLQAFRRQLRKQFDIETASDGAEGLEAITSRGPFAVILSDMRMPGMDGIQFLAAAKQRAPQSVRIMLTGNADQRTAIEAVNQGHIFRFLTKPCPTETLIETLAAGVRQYQLVTAEKELLERTLRGSVKVLTELLALVNPTAFGQAARLRRVAQKLCQRLAVDQQWQVEIAAMLSQIGCVTIPPDTLHKMYHGQELTAEESQMLDAHPAIAAGLVSNIPRLEPVAKIIAYQRKRFDGTGIPPDSVAGKEIPIGARILALAIDYDALKGRGLSDADVIVQLRARSGWHDPEILAALEELVGFEAPFEIREVRLREVTNHMILAEDVRTVDGTLLVAKEQEITEALRQRLMNFARNGRLGSTIRVLVPTASDLLTTSFAVA